MKYNTSISSMSTICKHGFTSRALFCAMTALVVIALASCNNKPKEHKEFTTNEVVLLEGFQSAELGTKVYTNDSEFKVDTVYTKDGEYLVIVDHVTYPQTGYDRLFSADGKLLIGLSGCQECAISGYAVVYENDSIRDKVKGVIRTGAFDDAFPEFHWYNEDPTAFAQTLKEWYNQLKDNELDFKILYNSHGIPYEVKGIVDTDNAIEGPIEFGIYEGDDFWLSDLHGGELSFLTLFKDLDVDLNGEGLLYYEEYPCAKLTFEQGKVTKYTTYDRKGNVLTENEQPEGDIVGRILMEIELDW